MPYSNSWTMPIRRSSLTQRQLSAFGTILEPSLDYSGTWLILIPMSVRDRTRAVQPQPSQRGRRDIRLTVTTIETCAIGRRLAWDRNHVDTPECEALLARVSEDDVRFEARRPSDWLAAIIS